MAHIPRDHHYTPKAYLKAWADPEGQVATFRWLTTGKFEAKLRAYSAICYQKDLYSHQNFSPSIEEAQFFESKILSRVDSDGIVIRDRILHGEIPTDFHERQMWIRFMISFSFRHPMKMHELRQKARQLSREIILPEQRSDRYLGVVYGSEDHAEDILFGALAKMLDSEIVGSLMQKMHWGCREIDTSSCSLLTSDAPLASLHLRERHGAAFMALAPNKLFVACNDKASLEMVLNEGSENLCRLINIDVVNAARLYVVCRDLSLREFVSDHLHRQLPTY